MIKLDVAKKKDLNFEVKVDGIDNKDLSGAIRLELDGIEYGFPVEILAEGIKVSIPPLKSVVGRPIKEGEKIKAKLEMNGNGYYIKPWDEEFIVKNEVTVEAKLIDSNVKKLSAKANHLPSTSIIKESFKPKITKKSFVVTEAHVYKYMSLHGVKDKRIQETIYNQISSKTKSGDQKDILMNVISYLKNKGIK